MEANPTMNTTDIRPGTANVTQTDIDISVVVPFYNAGRYIERCIKALLAQTYPSTRYEIIMVDNNSTDGSAQLVRQYSSIRLLAEPKQGSYAARNRGVAAANGTIIAFTDADCVPGAGWLEKIVASMRAPGVELVQGGRLFARDSPVLSMLAAHEFEKASYVFSAKSNSISYGYTNNMAVRRDLFNRIGPFLEIRRGADSIFVHRVIEDYSPEVIRYVPDVCVRHLEITSVWQWLRKRFIYGRSYQQHRNHRKGRRDLTPAERAEIIKRTVQRNGYSLLQKGCLILLIRMAKRCTRLGRLCARIGAIIGA